MRVRVLVVGGVLVALLCSALTGVLHRGNTGSPLADGVTDWWLTGVSAGVVYALTGGWLLWRRPDLLIGTVLLGIGTTAAVAMASLEYGLTSLDRAGLPLGGTALWLGNWMWAASMVSVVALVPHLVPEGSVPPGRRRLLAAAGVMAVLAVAVSWMVTPYDEISPAIAARAENPFAVRDGLVRHGLLAVTLVGTMISVGSVWVRWHRSRGVRRQQLKWVLVGVVASLLLFAAGFGVGPVATAAAMIPVPAAIVLAVLRSGLWDVDVVISRGLTWLAVVLTLTSVYVGVQAGTSAVLGAPPGARWPGVLAAAVTVALAQPVHRTFQREVNLRVHGVEDDPATVLTELGHRLESRPVGGQSAEALLGEAMASLTGQLGIEGARVTLTDGGSVGGGDDDEGPWHAIPLTHAGRQVGALNLPVHLDRLSLGQRRQVARLLPGLAVAAHGALLERLLERARGELAGVRREERRELHRELHDGLGPSLAAMALKVEIAADLVVGDPVRAEGILKEVVPQLSGTVADVRSVVLGLRPTALEQLGLEGALRELAAGFTGPAQQVQVSCERGALDGLHAATEVAAYRIAAEALTNAHRHARASSIELEVRRLEEMLEVTITDDGTGLSTDHRPGVGLASMSGRAAEVGGRLLVGPSPHGRGTRVSALLPGVVG